MVWSMNTCKTQRDAALASCKGAEGIAVCRRMCEEENNPMACSNLGYAYLEGRYIELDRARALALFERSCRAGEEYGCSNLGAMLLVGSGVPAEPRRGLELSIRACYAEPKLCGNAAVAYRDGIGTQVNHARSVELFSRGCIGGSADECDDVAIAYSNGLGVPKDLARAAELRDVSCRGGHMHACAALGSDYLYGKGVEKDSRRAAEYARYACERGKAPFGCTMLGLMTISGEGGLSKDRGRGYDLMKWGCENDNRGANCAVLGEVYRVEKDWSNARYYFEKSCKAGWQDGCDRLETTGKRY
jgi:TPR repeat protein